MTDRYWKRSRPGICRPTLSDQANRVKDSQMGLSLVRFRIV